MNNSNKCTCLSNKKIDRISSLPDEMLQHILSFLGMRKAVQTSLVSKRWVNLWTSLSHLNFDPHEFVCLYEYSFSTEDRKRAHDAKFREFVETVLSRCEASFLDTFLIKILGKGSCSDLVRTCTSYAMKFNPRVFSMEAAFFYKDISACIFSCESIEELWLGTSCNYLQKIPDVVNLPRIRRLQLTGARLDNRSITRLFSGCPVLENVLLEDCVGEFSCIFSQKLKYLFLRRCFLNLHSDRVMYVFYCLGDAIKSTISIPGACPFILFKWKALGATAVGNSTCSFMRNLFGCLDLDDYLGGFSDVTVLKLNREDMMYILEAALPKLGEFQKLKDFSLGTWCMTCNFSPIALFLQRTPNLQKITLYMSSRHCRGKKTSIHRMLDNLTRVYLSQCKNLKQVDIKLLKDYIRAHKIGKALLPSRKQLENVEIIISEHI